MEDVLEDAEGGHLCKRTTRVFVWYGGWWDLDIERLVCASKKDDVITSSLMAGRMFQYTRDDMGNWPMPQQTSLFCRFSGGHDGENHAFPHFPPSRCRPRIHTNFRKIKWLRLGSHPKI